MIQRQEAALWVVSIYQAWAGYLFGTELVKTMSLVWPKAYIDMPGISGNCDLLSLLICDI